MTYKGSTGQEEPRSPESWAEELSYRLRQQEITSEYALFALTTHDSDALLKEAVKQCAYALDSSLCKVMEYLPDEEQFLVREGVGWKPGVVGHARSSADPDTAAGYVFRTGESVISSHLQDKQRFRTPPILIEHGVKRAINAPVLTGDRRFGILEVDSPVSGRFTGADLIFVTGFANLLGVALERQGVEEALRRKEDLLQSALAHQEVLAQEVSHRVKNSLSIVAGLLNMQGRDAEDPALKRALADAESRVQAIAKVHDRLWRKDEVHSVDLAEFLGELCSDIASAAPRHDVRWEVVPVSIATDQAISLGLLINELITNALKYAYPDGAGVVYLRIAERDEGRLRLEVRDEGVGLAEGKNIATGTGFGRRVITALSRHLNGRVEWRDAKPGTVFIMSFRPNKT